MFGIEGYDPQWHHRAHALAAAHRGRFARLLQQRVVGGWLMWDLDGDHWFADGSVILAVGDMNIEITHRKFDECAITWNQVDMSMPLHWGNTRLDWRADGHPALRTARGRRLRGVNIIERLTPAHWRPTVLYAVEMVLDGPARLMIFNAMDENGLTDAAEVELPVARWRRVPIA